MLEAGRAGVAVRDQAGPSAAASVPGKRTRTEELAEGPGGAAAAAPGASADAPEEGAGAAADRAVPVAPAPVPEEEGAAGAAPGGAPAPAPAPAAADAAVAPPKPLDGPPTPAPAPGVTPPSGPAPSSTPSGPGASVAASFNATEVAHPSVPAFGEVDWNANEPVATYAAYRDGSNWRFRLETLSLDVPVGVASGGRTDVPSATAPVVTSSTWRLVASDLTPGGGTPNRSPRSTYWAEDLTWIHERFHFNEFNTFLRTSFASFETTIEGTGYTEAVSGTSDTEAAALGRKRADLRTRLLAAWNQAKTNMSPAMEDRAYDDGAPLYQARADAVRARARREGWIPRPRVP
jgi:hypothetical protein